MASSMLPTFVVDKAGLAKLLERRGKAFAVTELIQNAWDENVTTVNVALTPTTRGKWGLIVTDDSPDGFADIAHAYTLFAESKKKADASKRGRFNLGEKLVVAICDDCTISTTTGTVTFSRDGRTMGRARRDSGTEFRGVLRMTKADADEVGSVVRSLIPPEGVTTTFNGEAIEHREPLATFEARLHTERANAEGLLIRSTRQASVSVYEPRDGEMPSLYELGIPVVETGDRWHVDVGQKVPLTTDRDNVTPAFLRDVRAEVMNHCAHLLREADAGERWIDDALADERIVSAAIDVALDRRYGEKRVMFDPSDQEANARAVASGYTVVPSHGLPKGVAAVARKAGVLKPAGQVTPAPRPYADEPGGEPRHAEPREKWTAGMCNIAEYAAAVASRLLDCSITVEFVNDAKVMGWSACYGRGHLEFNLRVLGRKWFDRGPTPTVNALLIHEFGHHRNANHLSDGFHDSLCDLGAALADLALNDPGFFQAYRVTERIV